MACATVGQATGFRRLPVFMTVALARPPHELFPAGRAAAYSWRVARSGTRFPDLHGKAVEIRFLPALEDRRGPVHGGAFLRERRIACEAGLRKQPAKLARILAHELFHFAWIRLGNPARRSWEDVLAGEAAAGAAGELGWSAEWRKAALQERDRALRTRRWREYCCESFCDTAAWLFSGVRRHPEFTLGAPHRAGRRRWFRAAGLVRRISI